MMYEIHFKGVDGSAAKEMFTATNDKKAIQRIGPALERLAGASGKGSYRLVDAKGRELVGETDLPLNRDRTA